MNEHLIKSYTQKLEDIISNQLIPSIKNVAKLKRTNPELFTSEVNQLIFDVMKGSEKYLNHLKHPHVSLMDDDTAASPTTVGWILFYLTTATIGVILTTINLVNERGLTYQKNEDTRDQDLIVLNMRYAISLFGSLAFLGFAFSNPQMREAACRIAKEVINKFRHVPLISKHLIGDLNSTEYAKDYERLVTETLPDLITKINNSDVQNKLHEVYNRLLQNMEEIKSHSGNSFIESLIPQEEQNGVLRNFVQPHRARVGITQDKQISTLAHFRA